MFEWLFGKKKEKIKATPKKTTPSLSHRDKEKNRPPADPPQKQVTSNIVFDTSGNIKMGGSEPTKAEKPVDAPTVEKSDVQQTNDFWGTNQTAYPPTLPFTVDVSNPRPDIKNSGEKMEENNAQNDEPVSDDDMEENKDFNQSPDAEMTEQDYEEDVRGPVEKKQLTEGEIRKECYDIFEENPDISSDEVINEFEELGIRDEFGHPISKGLISSFKGQYFAWLEKRKQRIATWKEVQEMEKNMGIEPVTPDFMGLGVNEPIYVDQFGNPVEAPVVQHVPPPQPKPQPQRRVVVQSQPQQQSAQNPAPQSSSEKFVMPERKTRLQLLFEQLDYAVKNNNPGLARIVADGIYSEYDKADGGGGNDKMFGLVATMVSGMFKSQIETKSTQNPTAQLRDMVGIVKDLMPQDRPAESENVQMARAVGDIVHHATGELKDTVLTVTGHRNEATADKFGVCPYCNKLIMIDSQVCSYCGGRLATSAQPGIYQQPPQQEPPQQQQIPPQYTAPPPPPHMHSSYAPPDITPPPMQSQVQVPPQNPQSNNNGGMNINKHNIDQIRKYAKQLAGYISAKENPSQIVNFAWKWLGEEDKEKILLAVVLEPSRLYYCVDRLAPQFPEIAPYVAIIKSVEGRDWLNIAIQCVADKARESNMKLTKQRYAELLVELQTMLGFDIPNDVQEGV